MSRPNENSVPRDWDEVQIEYINNLIDKNGIKNFFETGTGRGHTSLYFYSRGLKVFTVEIDKKRFDNCLETFSGTDITAYNTNSAIAIKQYLMDDKHPDTLFYLDAHQPGGHLTGYGVPLKDELNQLFTLSKFLLMIQVFHSVPHMYKMPY